MTSRAILLLLLLLFTVEILGCAVSVPFYTLHQQLRRAKLFKMKSRHTLNENVAFKSQRVKLHSSELYLLQSLLSFCCIARFSQRSLENLNLCILFLTTK